jgi:hypothetical protein
VMNSCKNTIWIDYLTACPVFDSNLQILSGKEITYKFSLDSVSNNFHPKMFCDSQGQNCKIGDQNPAIASLFEVTWAPSEGAVGGGTTSYDVSLVNGYEIPLEVTPVNPVGVNCSQSTCTIPLSDCPTDEDLSQKGRFPALEHVNLQYKDSGKTLVGCFSPCTILTTMRSEGGFGYVPNSPEANPFCCPPPMTSAECSAGLVVNTTWVKTIHQHCTRAYAYAFDDAFGLSTCQTPNQSFVVEYCPSGSGNSSGRCWCRWVL